MRHGEIKRKTIAVTLATGAILGSLYLFNFWLLGRASPLVLAAGAVLILFACAILRKGGVNTKAIAITLGAGATIVGLYVFFLWLSLRNWHPAW